MSDRPSSGGLTLAELAALIDGQVIGDPALRVARVRAPRDAGPGDLTFIGHPRLLVEVRATGAAAFLTDLRTAAHVAHELPCAVLAVDDPGRALVRVLEVLHPAPRAAASVDARAVVDPAAVLGARVGIGPLAVVGRATLADDVQIGALAFVDDDVTLGPGTSIGPGAVILRGTRVGARVIVHPGVVVGADGFGYAPDGAVNVKVPQVGGVVLADDVELGANACVDRGALSDTAVGARTKIDNLVQVAHDVALGDDVVVIAQTGIAGFARVGDGAVLAGQTGVVPYAHVGAGARVGAQSGVTRDVDDGAAVSGTPAYAHLDWLKTSARLRHVDGMYRRLARAEHEILALRALVDELRARVPAPSPREPEDP